MADLTAGLNPEQRRAVETVAGPLLVYAGAGSGKTRVITHRIAHLIADCGVDPGAIVGLTFTNNAAREMRERVERLTGGSAGRLMLTTFHSFGARLLRREAVRAGFTIYDEYDQLGLLKRIIREMNLDPKQFSPGVARHHIDRAKDQLRDPDSFDPRQEAEDWVRQVFRKYEAALAAQNAFDYGDLIRQPVYLLRRDPARRAAYHRRWEYYLVDEWQDTNLAQYELLRELVNDRHNVCVVGDDNQSIYGWRGACPANLERFGRDYPEATILTLPRNYRSGQAILDLANALIGRGGAPGRIKLLAESDRTGHVAGRVYPAEFDETRAVVNEAVRLHRAGIPYREMAVMYRTHWLSRQLEDTLLRSGIPYQVISGTGFYARQEIKDLLAYLKLVVNPRDTVSLERIVNVPTRGIGAKAWETILDGLRAGRELAALAAELKGAAKPGLLKFAALLDGWRGPDCLASPALLLERIIAETNYLSAFDSEDAVQREVREDNLRELVGLARQFEQEEGEGGAFGFLEEMSLLTDTDAWDADADQLNLMSLHAAKGLEFTVIFLIALEDGILPHISCQDDPAELAEERRLLYVGITRAKEHLFLSAARDRMVFGSRRSQPLSPFFRELFPGTAATAAAPAAPPAWRQHQPRGSRGAKPKAETVKRPIPTTAAVRRGESVVWAIHPRLGRGKLLARWGAGEGEMAEVDFLAVGRKQLKVKYANLRFEEGD